jgi:hypothetical protein
MIQNIILATTIILVLFTGWVLVQHLARHFAYRHPQFGPAREEGVGCGAACRCSAAEQADCPDRQRRHTPVSRITTLQPSEETP